VDVPRRRSDRLRLRVANQDELQGREALHHGGGV
jgi:hypothetical protein